VWHGHFVLGASIIFQKRWPFSKKDLPIVAPFLAIWPAERFLFSFFISEPGV
jgi:hypothetical protein